MDTGILRGRRGLSRPQRAFAEKVVELKARHFAPKSLSGGSRISVVIPHYNHADYLGATIESALGQTRAPFEVIVVDDSSTDQEAFRKVQELYHGLSQVKFLHPEGKLYAGGARQFGLEKASGDLVSFCDADDLMHPQRLEAVAGCMESRRDCTFVVTGYSTFRDTVPASEIYGQEDFQAGIIGPRQLTDGLAVSFARHRLSWIDTETGIVPWYAWGSFGIRRRYPPTSGTPTVRRELGSLVRWNSPKDYVFTPYEDYEYCALLHAATGGGYQIDLPLLYYRQGSTSNRPQEFL